MYNRIYEICKDETYYIDYLQFAAFKIVTTGEIDVSVLLHHMYNDARYTLRSEIYGSEEYESYVIINTGEYVYYSDKYGYGLRNKYGNPYSNVYTNLNSINAMHIFNIFNMQTYEGENL
jgi:hypothetical protein